MSGSLREPRTAWRHHPLGQTLYVTDGIGYVARRGGDGGTEVQEIRPRRRGLHRAGRGALAWRHRGSADQVERHHYSLRPDRSSKRHYRSPCLDERVTENAGVEAAFRAGA